MHMKSDTMNLGHDSFSESVSFITLSQGEIHIPTFALHLSMHIHKYNQYSSFMFFCLVTFILPPETLNYSSPKSVVIEFWVLYKPPILLF